MSHRCQAIGCEREVSPRLLFCSAHWELLSKELRKAIHKWYIPGQETRKDPSLEYQMVIILAQNQVAKAEGCFTPKVISRQHERFNRLHSRRLNDEPLL